MRLRFTTQRFAKHAKHWQFVIWFRQLLMTVLILLPGMLGVKPLEVLDVAIADAEADGGGSNASTTEAGSGSDGGSGELMGDFASGDLASGDLASGDLARFRSEVRAANATEAGSVFGGTCGAIECADEWVSWLQAGACMLIFLGFWLWHRSVHPYAFPFQNYLESWLFGSAAVFVLLALVYTFLPSRATAVELSLLVVLIGTVGAAAVYVTIAYRRKAS